MSFPEIAAIMTREYGSDARRMQIKGTLEILRLLSFMAERDITDISKVFNKPINHLNALAPQCPKVFRSDSHKINYLRRAVAEFTECSRIPIQIICSNFYSFKTFYTAIHESIQNLYQINLINGGAEMLQLISIQQPDGHRTPSLWPLPSPSLLECTSQPPKRIPSL